jgi:hypothetical protein
VSGAAEEVSRQQNNIPDQANTILVDLADPA